MDSTTGWVGEFMQWLVHVTDQLGYWGLLAMTFVESSVVPLPLEATLIPAGYLVQQGKMAFIPALMISVIGTVVGSYLNYWMAKHFGRSLFIRYGKFLMMNDAKLGRLEQFFVEHGAMSTFTGRLLPGLRHYIALPAGLARMHLPKFIFYTALGGLVLSGILLGLGYFIGASETVAKHYLPMIKLGIFLAVLLGIGLYVLRHWRKQKSDAGKL